MKVNWIGIIIFLALFTIGMVKAMPNDQVHMDTQHDVMCITRGEKLLGCMTEEGEKVSNDHFNHLPHTHTH